MRISAELRTFPLLGSGRRHAAGIPSSLTAVNNPPSSCPPCSSSPSSFSAFQPFSYLQQGLRRYFSCNFRIVPPIHLHEAAFPRLRAGEAASLPLRSQKVSRNTDRKHTNAATTPPLRREGRKAEEAKKTRRKTRERKKHGGVEVEGNGGAGNLGQRVSTFACFPPAKKYWVLGFRIDKSIKPR